MNEQQSVIELHRGEDAAAQTALASAQMVPALLSIAKSVRAFLALLLADMDLHPGQDQLLRKLQPNESISVSMLADQLAVRPSTVSKMLDRLIEKKLVLRAAHNRDARRTMIMLTPAGLDVRQGVKVIWDKLEQELTASLAEADLEKLMGALGQVDDLLSTKLRRLR